MSSKREPGEMASSPDEGGEAKEEKHSRRKSSKKDKKRDLEAGEEAGEERRHRHREHRHKKSKKSKSEHKSPSRSPLPSVSSLQDNDTFIPTKINKGNEHPYGDATVAHTFANSVTLEIDATTTLKKEASDAAPPLLINPMDLNVSGQRVEEMSIEETNKVRAKLGLKPLQIDGAKNADGSLVVTKKQEDVHAPPVNLTAVKKAAEIKDKIEARKEKRSIDKKLKKVKLLGVAAVEEEESTEAWAERTRREARQKAAEREKLQAEMDAQEAKDDREVDIRRELAYTAKDLKGLKVEHDVDKFQEGRDIILTLKDTGVLDEDAGDVLVSTALGEEERLKKNIENRKKKSAYNPYENADDIEQFGLQSEPQLLKKYDETIGGEQKRTFLIGADGSSSLRNNMAMAFQRQHPTVQLKDLQDLMSAPQRLAKEYYTDEEMATKFKKVKRIKKDRTAREESGVAKMRSRIIDDEDLPQFKIAGTSQTAAGMDDQDDDIELHLALSRTRRLKQQEASEPFFKSELMDTSELSSLGRNSDKLASAPSSSTDVYMDETSEFCRAVGGLPGSSRQAVKEETFIQPEYQEVMDMYNMDMDVDSRDRDRDDRKMQEDIKGGWSEVQFEAEPANLGSDEEEDGQQTGGRKPSTARVDSHGRRIKAKPILDDEPTCVVGVGSALNLIAKKGLLTGEDAYRHPQIYNNGKASSIPAQSYVVDDKIIEDDKRGRHERYMGPTVPFKEKPGYKPTFKLAYHDASGRDMNAKEAFRDLSHKFHGKGPGKLKTERRAKKYLEEKLLMEMSSVDTPLHTVEKMQQKQQELQTPYILLSGAAVAAAVAKVTTPISKKSNF